MLTSIFLDMDGVLVDLIRHSYTLAGVPESNLEEAHAETTAWDSMATVLTKYTKREWTSADFWAFWKYEGDELWATAPWTAEGEELFKLCKEYAPTVLMTTPTIEPSSAAGKMRWIQRNLLRADQRRYAMCPCKHLMARPTAMLIDDGPHNIEAFRKAGGATFTWPQPWNDGDREVSPIIQVDRALTECAR